MFLQTAKRVLCSRRYNTPIINTTSRFRNVLLNLVPRCSFAAHRMRPMGIYQEASCQLRTSQEGVCLPPHDTSPDIWPVIILRNLLERANYRKTENYWKPRPMTGEILFLRECKGTAEFRKRRSPADFRVFEIPVMKPFLRKFKKKSTPLYSIGRTTYILLPSCVGTISRYP
jgi:hypothetical protein